MSRRKTLGIKQEIIESWSYMKGKKSKHFKPANHYRRGGRSLAPKLQKFSNREDPSCPYWWPANTSYTAVNDWCDCHLSSYEPDNPQTGDGIYYCSLSGHDHAPCQSYQDCQDNGWMNRCDCMPIGGGGAGSCMGYECTGCEGGPYWYLTGCEDDNSCFESQYGDPLNHRYGVYLICTQGWQWNGNGVTNPSEDPPIDDGGGMAPQNPKKRRGGITSLVDNTMGDGYGGCASCTTSMDCPPMTQCMGGSSPFGGCCVGRGPSGGPQPPKKRRGGRF